MNIWLITTGETIPSKEERAYRTGILTDKLIEKGHKVVWWTTTFDHQKKTYLYDSNKEVVVQDGYKMFFLHSNTSYKKNISLSRLINHSQVADSFAIQSRKELKPDVILCSFPTIDLSYEAVKYGRELNVPVIIDIRDLWPDIFINPFPRIIHPIIKLGLFKYIKQTRYIFKNCQSITGVSEKYLNFGLEYGNRRKTDSDKIFPLGYYLDTKCDKDIKSEKFNHLNIDSNKINVWFIGTFGKTYDLSTVIKSARKIDKYNSDICFIFTGDGENMKKWKNESKGLNNIVFTGWIGKKELKYISLHADIGLMAYAKGAPQGLPNKIFEYMAFGLPILSSLQNETKELLEKENVGMSYDPGSSEDLILKVKNLVFNRNILDGMKNNCKKLFNEKYNSNIVYKEITVYLENQSKNHNGTNK